MLQIRGREKAESHRVNAILERETTDPPAMK